MSWAVILKPVINLLAGLLAKVGLYLVGRRMGQTATARANERAEKEAQDKMDAVVRPDERATDERLRDGEF